MSADGLASGSKPCPIRVLFVIPGESGGASMVFAKRQVKSLAESGVVVESFFLTSRISPMRLLAERARFRSKIREFQPRIVHVQYGTMTAFFCTMATSLPIVVTYRGSDLNPCVSISWLRSALGRLLSQLAALRAQRIICVSDKLKRRLWWRRSRAVTIPSGVDLEQFCPRPQDAARHMLGWNNAERVVLFNAGADPSVKRLDLAQQSVEEARKLCGDIRFATLDGTVAPEEIPLLMNAADCLLVTSDWEGSPNVIKEAMATNLPIVSVDSGDVRERLNGASQSWIVNRDPHALGKALATALTSRVRSDGRAFIEELSAQKIASRIQAVYHEALTVK